MQGYSDNLQKLIKSNHDELMSNYFAQADALALGKTAQECKADGVSDDLIPHKVFSGNRPSNLLMFKKLNAFVTGQILSMYEHRTAVQGFVWDINSFDQWGVELGKVIAFFYFGVCDLLLEKGKKTQTKTKKKSKVLGKKVRASIDGYREKNEKVSGYNSSTQAILTQYLKSSM